MESELEDFSSGDIDYFSDTDAYPPDLDDQLSDSQDEDSQLLGSGVSCLSIPEIQRQFNAIERGLVELLDLPSVVVSVMHAYFDWNTSRMQDSYLEQPTETLKALGLEEDLGLLGKEPKLSDTNFTCPVCCTNSDHALVLPCGHSACIECYSEYISGSLDARTPLEIRCIGASECPVLLGREACALLSPAIEKHYDATLTELYIAANKVRLRPCNSPDCEYFFEYPMALLLPRDTCGPVKCRCGASMCFQCGSLSHDPLPCSLFGLWLQIGDPDAQSLLYIRTSCKICPGCSSRVERISGCNHMTCTRCNKEYCWICLGEWKAHNDNLNCTRFVPEDYSSQVSSTKALKDRIFHYTTHFGASFKAQQIHAGAVAVLRNLDKFLRKNFEADPEDKTPAPDRFPRKSHYHKSNEKTRLAAQGNQQAETNSESNSTIAVLRAVKENPGLSRLYEVAYCALRDANSSLAVAFALLFFLPASHSRDMLDDDVESLDKVCQRLALLLINDKSQKGKKESIVEVQGFVQHRVKALNNYITSTKWTHDKNVIDQAKALINSQLGAQSAQSV